MSDTRKVCVSVVIEEAWEGHIVREKERERVRNDNVCNVGHLPRFVQMTGRDICKLLATSSPRDLHLFHLFISSQT